MFNINIGVVKLWKIFKLEVKQKNTLLKYGFICYHYFAEKTMMLYFFNSKHLSQTFSPN